ncbi:permease [Fusobacterium varium]|nr:permease [Fusobacterium varium]
MYFFLFMLYSFIGWIYETIIFSLEEGHFINRGFNFGPYIPIYGFGAVIIMIIISRFIAEPDKSNKFNIRPLKIFLLILILSTFAELIGSYIMEYTLGLVLWDYSNEWMNFQGRISPRTSFIFAAGGTAVFYTIQPLGKKLIDRISVKGQKIFASILLTLVLIDFSASLVTTIWFSNSIKKAGIIERK